MPEPEIALDLRPATVDDAGIVADLDTVREPEDPRDPAMMRFWWTPRSTDEVVVRHVAERHGAAVAFVAAGHDAWASVGQRFGWIRAILHPEIWSEPRYADLMARGESWLGSEDAATAVTRIREDFQAELEVVGDLGYREVRRHRISELDLVSGRERLLSLAGECRRRMRDEGIQMVTIAGDSDPDRMAKLHAMSMAAEKDIPTTMPWRALPFEEWKEVWFGNPGVREDRFWIAREGDEIVGLSMLEFPPLRGLPWTAFTATSRAVRGRGIARALKYETVSQAIELGYERVRTMNDGANEPILHINREMGYELVVPTIELHKELS